MELTFDDILGNDESWDESEIYKESETNEVPQGERGTCEALVSCTSAYSESETVRMTGSGNETNAFVMDFFRFNFVIYEKEYLREEISDLRLNFGASNNDVGNFY